MSGCECELEANSREQSRVLWILLAINGAMFFVEFGAGWLVQSTALIADSLDMFADASVYGVSLYGVSRGLRAKAHAAFLMGGLQLALGAIALYEVVRRCIVGSNPDPSFMVYVALGALVANLICFVLISKHKEGGVHMRASWICSRNDVIANVGVIAGAGLVAWTGRSYPDLIVGAMIGLLVLSGGVRIVKEARVALDLESSGG